MTEADTCLKSVVPLLQSAAAQAGKPGADPFGLLCPLAVNQLQSLLYAA
jgi:hypothetical protein